MGAGLDVAIFAPGLLAGGGAEKTALCLATALRDSGLSVACYTDSPVDAATLGDHFGLDLGRIAFPELPSPRRPRGRLPRAVQDALGDRSRLRAVRKAQPRLFVNMLFKSSLPGAGAANWYFVHFPHRLGVPSRSPQHRGYLAAVGLFRRLLLHPGRRRFVDSYDLVTANSDFTGHHVSARWGVKAETLYPPCDVAPGTATAGPRERIILGVGRFQALEHGVPHKNQHVMVDAFSRLDDLIDAGWELHLLGAARGTGAEDYLQEVRTMAAGLPVRLHPNASQAELDDLRRRASIYWHAQGFGTDVEQHPEAQEHFGISTVEAMAAGVIPLAYATAGPLEVLAPLDQGLTWTTLPELLESTRAVAVADDTSAARSACLLRAQDFSEQVFRTRVLDVWARLVEPPTREDR
jgi:glycosyltransferase involved in cell wall biosynthesis